MWLFDTRAACVPNHFSAISGANSRCTRLRDKFVSVYVCRPILEAIRKESRFGGLSSSSVLRAPVRGGAMSERRKDGNHFNHLCVDRRGAIKLGVGGAVLAAVGHRFLNMPAQAEERVSSFGVYKGYSSEAYDGWKRTSQYVAVRDGTRLAMDIFRSFGTTTELSNPLDAQDGYAITERLAKQPRSTGNIGMF